MLDIRVESFLSVWKNKSYTKAAEDLCITQPAVTQHVKALERKYNCKLIQYSGKELRLTKAGEIFYKYAQNMKANESIVADKLAEINKTKRKIKFAATLTIGEFTLAPVLADFIKTFDDYNISMYVDNTKSVLNMLQNGLIDFALVEGLFNKADYETRLYKNASFILIGPPTHPLASKKTISLSDLENETIIVREKGSGSREVLERALFDRNYTLENFNGTIEIGNVSIIKNMVKENLGLTFMYRDAAYEEINNGQLIEIEVSDFSVKREFNFVYIKNQLMQHEMETIFFFFKNNIV